jgi:hypothetical protein
MAAPQKPRLADRGRGGRGLRKATGKGEKATDKVDGCPVIMCSDSLQMLEVMLWQPT